MRIALADDHPLFLAGVQEMLAADGDFEVVGTARRGAEVLPVVARTQPDVLLLDYNLGDADGLTVLERVLARYPELDVVVMASRVDLVHVQATFQRGACGFILKTVDARDLASAIRQAVDGSAYHAHGLPGLKQETVAHEAGLTERETEILRAVARGLSNKEVARELWVTEQTVKFHLSNVYRKLGVANRTEAARWALRNGLRAAAD